jgi:hypothetical protein
VRYFTIVSLPLKVAQCSAVHCLWSLAFESTFPLKYNIDCILFYLAAKLNTFKPVLVVLSTLAPAFYNNSAISIYPLIAA